MKIPIFSCRFLDSNSDFTFHIVQDSDFIDNEVGRTQDLDMDMEVESWFECLAVACP